MHFYRLIPHPIPGLSLLGSDDASAVSSSVPLEFSVISDAAAGAGLQGERPRPVPREDLQGSE